MLAYRKNIAAAKQDDSIHTATEGAPLTARAGGGQANATLLNYGANKVGTVASAADSVKLPIAVGGQVVYAANQGANSMQVFGDATVGDTINAVASATGVAVANGKNAIFICTKTAIPANSIAGEWFMILSA